MTGIAESGWTDGAGRLTAGGRSLEWACWGPPPGDGPVLVLLHEGLGCVALWRGFPARLAEVTGRPVFAFSRAGYGQSDPADLPRPVDYMPHEATRVLPEVLEALGAHRHILMGHSDGATIAAEYAGRVPDHRLQGLVLMAPHFFTEPMGLAEIARAGEVFAASDMAARMGKYHRDPVLTFRGWNDVWMNPDFRDWYVGDIIGHWQVPALVIQGREDQYGTLAQVSEVEARSPALVRSLVLEDCQHSPHFDQPEAVLTAVRDFLAWPGVAGAA